MGGTISNARDEKWKDQWESYDLHISFHWSTISRSGTNKWCTLQAFHYITRDLNVPKATTIKGLLTVDLIGCWSLDWSCAAVVVLHLYVAVRRDSSKCSNRRSSSLGKCHPEFLWVCTALSKLCLPLYNEMSFFIALPWFLIGDCVCSNLCAQELQKYWIVSSALSVITNRMLIDLVWNPWFGTHKLLQYDGYWWNSLLLVEQPLKPVPPVAVILKKSTLQGGWKVKFASTKYWIINILLVNSKSIWWRPFKFG